MSGVDAAATETTRVASVFGQLLGRAPEGVWSAPGRVNLIGEHTDYNKGLVLPIALPQRTSAAAARRRDEIVRVHSVGLAETAEVALGDIGAGVPAGWLSYVAGVLWALREEGYPVTGLDVVVDSTVPSGRGYPARRPWSAQSGPLRPTSSSSGC